MNRNIYVQSIRLIGKLVKRYGISPDDWGGSDRELIEQAIRDNAFYDSTPEPVATGAKRKPARAA